MTANEKGIHQSFHEVEAAKCADRAKSMNALADKFDALSQQTTLTDPSASAIHKNACEDCRKVAGSHVESADNHLAAHKKLGEMADLTDGPTEKVQAGEAQALLAGIAKLLGTTMPTSVSQIPTFVPRHGQPTAEDRTIADRSDPFVRNLIGEIPA